MIDMILELLSATNTSAYRLTKDLGLSNSAISDWKSGKAKPSLDAIIKIANYFNVSADFLMGRQRDSHTSAILRNRVRNLCDGVNFQIADFENKTHLHYLSFRAWLNGYGDYCDHVESLQKLAEFFNVPVDYLLGITDESNEINDCMKNLNDLGRQKASEYIKDLTENPRYRINMPEDAKIVAQKKPEKLSIPDEPKLI